MSPDAIASARRLIAFERRSHGDKDLFGFALQALDALEAERAVMADEPSAMATITELGTLLQECREAREADRALLARCRDDLGEALDTIDAVMETDDYPNTEGAIWVAMTRAGLLKDLGG